MAFLDNSGDIILDAVLTDTGRMRLARGDGSFNITKFALGDDEIDYTLYNKNDARGSAFYDLEIMQTPILEAFTNNTSLMKSRLLTVGRNDLLYLPILKLNESELTTTMNTAQASGSFIVAADQDTVNAVPNGIGTGLVGQMLGATPQNPGQSHIRIDQGLDTPNLSPAGNFDEVETQYSIEIDNRLGLIYTSEPVSGAGAEAVSFIDDDNIASYYFTLEGNSNIVSRNGVTDNVGEGEGSNEVIRGPRGTTIKFRIGSSLNLQTSDFLFNTLGRTGQQYMVNGTPISNLGIIDTHVRITGLTTGYRIDIPVQFVKKIS